MIFHRRHGRIASQAVLAAQKCANEQETDTSAQVIAKSRAVEVGVKNGLIESRTSPPRQVGGAFRVPTARIGFRLGLFDALHRQLLKADGTRMILEPISHNRPEEQSGGTALLQCLDHDLRSYLTRPGGWGRSRRSGQRAKGDRSRSKWRRHTHPSRDRGAFNMVIEARPQNLTLKASDHSRLFQSRLHASRCFRRHARKAPCEY